MGALCGIEGRQEAYPATNVENRSGILEPSGDPRSDLHVIFVPLTVERRNGAGARRQIIKRNVRGGSIGCLPFRVDGPVERIEFLRREDVALLGEVGGIGFDVSKAPPGERPLQASANLVVPISGHETLFPEVADTRCVRHGLFSMMASSYARGTGCGCRSCPLPNTTYFSHVSWLRPIGPRA